MAPKRKRAYNSPARERQAEQTRRKIAAAARKLLAARGYAGMSIDAVAEEAGVASQTVYAVFGSKTGILNALLDDALFGDQYQQLVDEALGTSDPAERLRFAARIARQIYDSERGLMDLLRGAGVVTPDLARPEHQRERNRYNAQEQMIDYLAAQRSLRRTLDTSRARDILWMLTSRDVYRMLVHERGWSPTEFEAGVGTMLVELLLSDDHV